MKILKNKDLNNIFRPVNEWRAIAIHWIFFWSSSSGGDKKGGIQYFVVVQWGELLKIGQFCLNQNNKKKTFPDPHYTEHNSLTVAMS